MPLGGPDSKLVTGLLLHDPAAMERLMHRYGRLLWCIISGYLHGGKPEDIEEILSDVLYTVWRDIEQYDPQRAGFKTWLVMKTRYAALMHRRKLTRTSQREGPLPAGEYPHSAPNDALRIDLTMALAELKPLDRQIVYLCDYLSWDRQTVAEELGMKINTLNTRLHRIRRRLREMLQAWAPQEVR